MALLLTAWRYSMIDSQNESHVQPCTCREWNRDYWFLTPWYLFLGFFWTSGFNFPHGLVIYFTYQPIAQFPEKSVSSLIFALFIFNCSFVFLVSILYAPWPYFLLSYMANLFYYSMYLSCFTVTYLFNINSNKKLKKLNYI